MENKKQVMMVALVLLAITGIILWLRRNRKDESGYVMPRGFFLPVTTTTTTPTTPTTPTTTPDSTAGARTTGSGTTSDATPPTPTPTPAPNTPYPVAGGIYFYDPIMKTYILNPMAQVSPQEAAAKVEVAKAEVAKIESAKSSDDMMRKFAIISPLLLIVVIFLIISKNY